MPSRVGVVNIRVRCPFFARSPLISISAARTGRGLEGYLNASILDSNQYGKNIPGYTWRIVRRRSRPLRGVRVYNDVQESGAGPGKARAIFGARLASLVSQNARVIGLHAITVDGPGREAVLAGGQYVPAWGTCVRSGHAHGYHHGIVCRERGRHGRGTRVFPARLIKALFKIVGLNRS